MRVDDALHIIMLMDGVSRAEMAKRMGYASPTGVTNLLHRRNGMRVDTLIRMATALGYTVILRKEDEEEFTLTES